MVSGTVRRLGDRMRVTAQLTDVERGQLLWSDQFDRAFTDVFTVQDEISRAIATALRVGVNTGALGNKRMTIIGAVDSIALYDAKRAAALADVDAIAADEATH